MTNAAKGLTDVLDKINKQYGPGTILAASKSKTLALQRIETGIFELDLKIGGGIPRGRMTVLKGEWSTGKTAVALKSAAQFQHHCRFCGTAIDHYVLGQSWSHIGCECGKNAPMRVVWLDAEHSFDTDWAKQWGIDTDSLYVIQTEYAEQGIDVADACIRSGECDLLVVDSIAALTPSVEIEESAEKWQMGVAARLMNKAMRKWTSGMNSGGLLSETQCTIILINQLRLKLGGYHVGHTSPGGKGIDFFESVEIKLKRGEWLEDPATKRPVALRVEFHVVKNKTAPAQQSGLYTLYFVNQPKAGYHVGDTDVDIQTIRAAVFWGLVKKGGSWFTFPWTGEKFQGEPKAAAALRLDPLKLSELQGMIRERELIWKVTGESDRGPQEAESNAEEA